LIVVHDALPVRGGKFEEEGAKEGRIFESGAGWLGAGASKDRLRLLPPSDTS
jgi:hypothetical protein